MKLSVKKLRRSATVIGGSFLGLGIAAALGTPALACHSNIEMTSACVNADNTWVVNWSISPSDSNPVSGRVKNVTVSSGTLTGIVGDTATKKGSSIPASGTQTLPADATEAWIRIQATFNIGRDIPADDTSATISKPTEKCDKTPPNGGGNTPPNKPPTKPDTEPEFVYDETCTTFTVGLEVPKTWKHTETAIFTPSVGKVQTVTVKPGETKTVDYPASKGLTVKASAKGYEDQKPVEIDYKAPKNCTSSSPATPAPSSSGPALAITGSSSTPIAGGAVALVLLGGGAFFLARRRKMKFTA